MKVFIYKNFVLVVIALLIVNCRGLSKQEASKDELFETLCPDCTMNSTVSFLPLQENYRLGENIILNYKNYSRDQLEFPPGSGVKILAYDQNSLQWIEVKNKIEYSTSPEPYIVIGPSDDMSSYGSVVISPDVVSSGSTEIRVVITGHIYQNPPGDDECIGAFTDIQL